jgi:hypothetical protein
MCYFPQGITEASRVWKQFHTFSISVYSLCQVFSGPGRRVSWRSEIAEIDRYIETDTLDGLQKACAGGEGNKFCVAYYTGNYPRQWVDVDEILPVTAAR